MKFLALSLPLFALAAAVTPSDPAELLPPVHIQVAGAPLDVEREGHAAPFVGDFFEDGTVALLVGQYDGGRLRIYRNTGTRTRPKFDKFIWFAAGGKIASVPEG